ncbi:hypothetical protein Tco_0436672 [Tanacetum coccineum]
MRSRCNRRNLMASVAPDEIFMLLGSDIGMVGYMRLGESMNQEAILRIIVERDPLRWACGIGIFALTFSKSVRFIWSEEVSSSLMEQEWNLPMKITHNLLPLARSWPGLAEFWPDIAGSWQGLTEFWPDIAGSVRVLAGYGRVCPGLSRMWPGLGQMWPDVPGSWQNMPSSWPDMPGFWPDVCPGLGQIWNL